MRLCSEFVPDADRIVGLPQGQAKAAARRSCLTRADRRRPAQGEDATRDGSQSLIRGHRSDNSSQRRLPLQAGRASWNCRLRSPMVRLNGAKRHAAADRVCHAVRLVRAVRLTAAAGEIAIRTYRSDDTLLRIGPYAFEGGKTLNLTVGIGQQRVPRRRTTRPTCCGRWATAAPTSNART